MVRRKLASLRAATLLLVLTATGPALADSSGDSQTIGNVVIYLGLLPAPMILGHPPNHPEASMHGGRPAGADQYHVIVALFDARDGKRITHAEVSARVAEIGLAGEEKKLDPMKIAGTVTYGNYFKMAGTGPFRIRLDIRGPVRLITSRRCSNTGTGDLCPAHQASGGLGGVAGGIKDNASNRFSAMTNHVLSLRTSSAPLGHGVNVEEVHPRPNLATAVNLASLQLQCPSMERSLTQIKEYA